MKPTLDQPEPAAKPTKKPLTKREREHGQVPRSGVSTRTLHTLLKKTKDLPDLAYEDQVHQTGFRVALWLLRAYATAPIDKPIALSSDRLKALQLYLERCDKHRLAMSSQRTRPAQSSPDEFLQQPRSLESTTSDPEPTT